MNKSVLLSIKPIWCRMIANEKKSVEVRKSKPNIEPPFKCYIYRSKDIKSVIGEFVCDEIIPIMFECSDPNELIRNCHVTFPETGMTDIEIMYYLGNGKTGYGWHISNLLIYDRPKSLEEFYYPEERYCEKGLCGGCPYDQVPNEYGEYAFDCEWKRPVYKPPQNWCYVQDLKG